ncbi:hypothetical protein EZV62_015082 [Acer yangbiense]|uniref:SWIM-type domain-containing protein n=1 Tax=Acer yangbiense TaxID=1000413 RepID=A0A5C7HUN8_9ROSI|nr:hypothetical protein EZV62_015082 [Acer yangbiense]
MDKILSVSVLYGTEVLELGECDADQISLINLVHAMTKEFSGRSELPFGGFTVSVELPWSSDTIMVSTDSELLDVFRQFVFRGYDAIRFQIKTTHCPPTNTPHSPIDEPEVVEQIGWFNKEAVMLDCEADSEGGDTESDEGVESDGEGVQTCETVESKSEGVYQAMFDEGVQTGETVESKGEGVYQAMFDEFDVGLNVNEGMFDEFDVGLNGVAGEDVNNGERVGLYDGVEDEGGVKDKGVQTDDDYFTDSDSDQENNKNKLGKLMEGIPFERQNEGEIKFFVGQTFGRKEEMRDIFREYAIREGVTLVDKHDCHTVYNNSEAKVKWIASKVESLVKSNPTKGLIKALETHFPFASKRYCARHIYANFRSSYPGDNYKKMFWKASRSSNLFHFKATLDSIREVDTKANEWLQKIDPHYWSKFAYDQYIRYDHVTNNMIEAFNSMLGTHRAQTYLQLLEFIRRMEYELVGLDGTFAVKLREYHCGCGSWQINGIPCPHAMAAISHSCGRQSVNDWVPNFVHQSLSKSAYIQTYRGMIHPLLDQKMWPPIQTAELLPPPYET